MYLIRIKRLRMLRVQSDRSDWLRINLVPRVFVPLDPWSENERSGSNYFEITKEINESCPSGYAFHCASSYPKPSFPLTSGRFIKPACVVRNEDSTYEIVSLRSLDLWRMSEMDAPRALVFRPLVKGTAAQDSGRIRNDLSTHAQKVGWTFSEDENDEKLLAIL